MSQRKNNRRTPEAKFWRYMKHNAAASIMKTRCKCGGQLREINSLGMAVVIKCLNCGDSKIN